MDKKNVTKRLDQFARNHDVLSLIGISKNAGKTTVMNHLIRYWTDKALCITSIGLDGEAFDTIAHHEKPRITLYPGMYIVTANDCLKVSTASIRILEETNIRTPMGKIIIGIVEKKGLVLIAGPSTKHEMKKVLQEVKKYRPFLTLIDGALFRKSSASTSISDGIIFVTGASYAKQLDTIIKDTKNIIDHFQIEEVKKVYINDENLYEKAWVYDENTQHMRFLQGVISQEVKKASILEGEELILNLPGALTDSIAEIVVKKRHKYRKLMIIVKDASHILISPKNSENLQKIGVNIKALRAIEIVFVAYNPFSPDGYQFDNETFKTNLHQAIKLEPVNVMIDWK